MPTLKTLFSAPVTSPLNEVDVEDVGLFLIQLTARGFLQSNEIQENHATCHDSMAYAICNQIIAQPMSFHVKILLKLLTSLQISDDDFSKLPVRWKFLKKKELLVTVQFLSERARSVHKFSSKSHYIKS